LEKIITFFRRFHYKGVLGVVAVFAIIAVILFVQLSGVQVSYITKKLDFLPSEQVVTKTEACATLSKDTLLLYDSQNAESATAFVQFENILNDMKVGHDAVDLAQSLLPSFAPYKTVIVLLSDLAPMGDGVLTLCNWVYTGGNAWLPVALEQGPYAAVMENKLGITSSADYIMMDNIYVKDGFMVGGGQAFAVADPFDSARAYTLSAEKTTVYATEEHENGMPLVWKATYGNGTFVVDNIGIYDKAFRGFYAASYSLLDTVGVYPVINGSTFYLDDFPSQIPDGNSTYIERDFHTTIRDFYINIWWPDMMNLADTYGMRFTGLAIECYDDAVNGVTDAKPDTSTFLNFGNMLLRKGGEIGYHGYNHQPLCFANCDYKGIYDYKTWQSRDAMKLAFDHLVKFCDTLFPDEEIAVYVPPSNLLSKEGQAFLKQEYTQIRTLSGIYFPDDELDFSLIQEFDTDKNGVVDQPRIIAGCDIDSFTQLAALSELNLHFVNNHFTHPDDALDPERGAELGWKELYRRFDNYLSWLYTSAPDIRNFTGSELSAATQRFAAVVPHKEITGNGMTLRLHNFYDEAQFMVRFNGKTPTAVSGGTLTRLTGDLYLLEATKDTVTVSLK